MNLIQRTFIQDDVAGYYISQKPQKAIKKIVVNDIFAELIKRNIEVRIVPNLEKVSDRVKKTKLDWSLCRMRYAKHMKGNL